MEAQAEVKGKVLPFEEIKKLYPDEWVLIGNPELLKNGFTGPVVDLLQRGVVLYHSVDRTEIAYKAKDVRKGYRSVACVYTGEIPQNRKYLL